MWHSETLLWLSQHLSVVEQRNRLIFGAELSHLLRFRDNSLPPTIRAYYWLGLSVCRAHLKGK